MFALNRQELILAGVLLLLGIGLLFFQSGDGGEEFLNKNPAGELNEKIPPSPEVPTYIIHVAGAVKFPGVYTLDPGKRIIDAVKAAGGVSWEGDLNRINLAAPLADGMQVDIPFKQEVEGAPTPEKQGQIQINRAGPDELETLPGIGPARAEAIIEFRERKGDFREPEDLLEISGIGEKTLDQLREHIRFY